MKKQTKNFHNVFEKQDILSFFLDIFVMPILNSPFFSSITKKIISLSSDVNETKRHAAHYVSMEIMYSFDHKLHWEKGIVNSISNFISQHFKNPRALRNRLRLVKKTLETNITALDENKITIFSLGAGSARSLFETLNMLSAIERKKIFNVFFVDKDADALSFAKRQAKLFPFRGDIQYLHDDINNIQTFSKNTEPNIIEMVGLLEYMDDESVVSTLNTIFRALPQEGVLITSHINYNSEMRFVESIIEWPLIYRNRVEIEKIIRKSLFKKNKSTLEYEPLNVHAIITLRK